MSQLFIALFGLGAVYMSMVSKQERTKRLAPVVGLCGQPFWLYSTFCAGQWGMFFLCCAYTVIYALAIYRTWKALA